MRTVMVFGTFDGIHDGHRAFLREAKHHGDYLIAVVTPDYIAGHLKGKEPRADVEKRIKMLEEEGVDKAVEGDDELDAWNVIKKYKPEVIALGYDQHALRESVEANLANFNWRPEITVLGAHQPEKYHNSLLGS
ncbi:MAG: adenylyltransferase/cytidyltransferase family protein [Candidatus Liptonbacteria bacterium]|nr:adenylyltransferase/cytidyltransferase family protein [Candidatus Liptonbacteria bacterium]